MATEYAGKNPVQGVLDEEQARIDARTASLAPAAPEAPKPPPFNPQRAMEDLARKSNVPVNLLMSIGESANGKTPEEAVSAATFAAGKLAPLLAEGKTPDEAMAAVLGEKSDPAARKAILDRAVKIAEEFYPRPVKKGPEENDLRDTAAQMGKSVLGDATSNLVRGAGAVGAGLADEIIGAPINMLYNLPETIKSVLTNTPYDPSKHKLVSFDNPLNGVADAIQQAGAAVFDPYISDEAKKAMADSTPEGELTSPGTWSLGKDPTIKGYVLNTLNVFGSLAPQIVTAIATKGGSLRTQAIAGASVGAASGGGDQAQQAGQMIDGMWQEKLPDGRSRLEAESQTYKAAIADGATPEEAYRITRSEAEKQAAMLGASIGAILGPVEGRLFNPLEKKLVGKGLAGSAAQVGLGMATEGVQEVTEGVAGYVGANQGAGTDENVMEGSLANFILGALGGGAAGALGGHGGDPTIPQQPGTAPGAPPIPPNAGSLPGPEPVAPAGAAPGLGGGDPNAGAAPGADPGGPFQDAAGAAPDMSFKDPDTGGPARPGQRFTAEMPDGLKVNVRFVRDTPQGPTFQFDDGTESIVPHRDIQTMKFYAPGNEPGATKEPMPPQPFGKSDGKPFETQKQAAKAMRAKGVNGTIFTVDGGFMVQPFTPKPQEPKPAQPDFSNVKPQSEAAAPVQPTPAAAPEPVQEAANEPIPSPGNADGGISDANPVDDNAGGSGPTPAMDEGKPVEGDAPGSSVVPPAATGGDVRGETVQQPVEVPGVETAAEKPAAPTFSEPVKAEMRKIGDEARAKEPRPSGSGLAVGSMDERAAQEVGAMESFLRAIRAGKTPDEAATIAKADVRAFIAKHNTRRPDVEWKVSDGAYDAKIDNLAERIKRADAPTPVTPAPVEAPETAAESAPAEVHPFKFKPESAISRSVNVGMKRRPKVKMSLLSYESTIHIDKDGQLWKPENPSDIDTDYVRVEPDQVASIVAEIADVEQKTKTKMLAYRNRFSGPAKDFAKQLEGAGFTTRLVEPDDSTSRYVYAEKDGKQIKIRFADHAQPTGYKLDAESGKEVEVPVGGYSTSKKTRNTASDYSIDPDTQLTQDEVLKAILDKPAADPVVESEAENKPDPAPTDAQKAAGNYQMKHIKVHGLDISIETEAGNNRSGTAPDGTQWAVTLAADYGYIKGTVGKDKDHIDVYVGPDPESKFVLVVDQNDLATGAFDEHKIIMGAKDAAEALKIYEAGFSDGKALSRVGGLRELTIDKLKIELGKPARWQKPLSPNYTSGKKTERVEVIKDFGEKIGGARKDRAALSIADLRADRKTETMTMAEAFPEPDWAAIVANGVDQQAVALAALLRNRLPKKPFRRSYQIQDWAEKVDDARRIVADLLESKLDADGLIELMTSAKSNGLTKGEIVLLEMLRTAEPEDFSEISRITVKDGQYYRKDWNSPPVYDAWGIWGGWNTSNRADVFAETAGDVIPAILLMRAKRAQQLAAVVKTDKPLHFGLNRQWHGPVEYQQIYVTAPSNEKIDIPGEIFTDAKEAWARIREQKDELTLLAQPLLEKPDYRRTTNRPRLGPEHRKGNVTPEMFTKAFGFRGVEFGNWNTGMDRQVRLNEAYDALFDMAGVLGIPTTAISLNGVLGLAFGSRGIKGAAAHYEPGKIVINLTKLAGAGSLAHEWWHAVDNYMAKQDGKGTDGRNNAEATGKNARMRSDYMSDRRYMSGSLPADLRRGFVDLRSAMARSAWFTRSKELDKARSVPYFQTTIEMAARAFEKMVFDRLDSRGMINDFLANINEVSGAYPTTVEMRKDSIGKAFDDVLTHMPSVLPANDKAMVTLPPVDPARIYDGPPVGMEWENADGRKFKVIARSTDEDGEGRVTFEMHWPEDSDYAGQVVTKSLSVETVESMIEMAAKDMAPGRRLKREALAHLDAMKAEAEANDNEAAAQAKDLADNFDRARGDEVGKTRRMLNGSANVRTLSANPQFEAIVILILSRGYKVTGWMGNQKNLVSPEGSGWEPKTWGQRGLMFAEYVVEQNEASASARKQAEAIKKILDNEENTPNADPEPSVDDIFDQLLDELAPETDTADVNKDEPADIEDTADEAPSGPEPTPEPDAAPDASDPETWWDSADESSRRDAFVLGGWTVKASGTLNEAAKRALDRDWADLTPTAKRLITETLSGKKGPAQSTRTTAGPRATPRTAGESLKSAATNIGDGIGAALDGLMNLYGNNGTVRSGPVFDEESYQKAKPFLIAAAKHFGAAGKDIAAAMRALIKALIDKGMDRTGLLKMRDVITRFGNDVKAGAINLDEDQSNDTGPTKERGSEPLADELSQDGEGAGPKLAGPDGGSESADVPQGNPNPTGDGPISDGGVERDSAENADEVSNPKPEEVEADPMRRSGTNPGNFAISDAFPLGEGTEGEKLGYNLAALRLIKVLDAENRYPTREEQAVMARYVGWGGLKTVFDTKHVGKTNQWGRAQAELKTLLTPEEYGQAFDSISNAHYTSRRVVQAMWRAVRHFGYSGGRALEPTVGTGNFLGLQPADLMSNTDWHGSDIDTVTGKLASYIYPDANIMDGVGFQKANFLNGVFDLAIGNPPFGGEPVRDPKRPDLSGLKIHNYVITKAGLHLRPGGVMAMVVTHRFLDTRDAEGRSRIDKDFRFIGAIRLPNNAFKENAGTEVVTDLIFLQKRRDGEAADQNPAWLDVDGKLEGGIRVNRYFAENPDHILGRSATDGTMYGGGKGTEYTVHSDGRDVAAEMERIISEKWAKEAAIMGDPSERLESATATETVTDLPIGGMLMDDKNRVMRRLNDNEHGEVQLEEVTAETYWHETAAAWHEALDLFKTVVLAKADRPFSYLNPENSAKLGRIAQQLLLNKKDGSRPKPDKITQAQQVIADMMDLDGSPMPDGWAEKATKLMEGAAERKRLGINRFGRLKGMLGLRRMVLTLMRQEITDGLQIEETRTKLREAYRAFVKAYGPVNSSANDTVMNGDIGAETSLESEYSAAREGVPEKVVESPVLTRRVNFPYRKATKAKDAEDGMHISISERGYVDLGLIASLTGTSVAEVKADLTERADPLVFLNPENDTYEVAEVYLSGNVVKKLEQAKDARLEANVAALMVNQPKPKTKEQITPSIRSMWMPSGVLKDFMKALGLQNPKAFLLADAGIWNIDATVTTLSDFGLQFAHARAGIMGVLKSAVSGKPLKVMDRVPNDKGGYTEVVNETETRDANVQVERLSAEFERWVYVNEERTKEVVEQFNRIMNTFVQRRFDGVKYLRIVGANTGEDGISIRNSQKNGAWRMITSQSTLLHHVVGAGKTFTAIIAVMERKRMGLSRKSVLAVPNHLVGQFAKDFYKLYPGARVLAASPADFEAKKRRKLFARMATGDYDAIIVGHSSLKFIETPAEDETMVIEEQLLILQEAAEEARKDKTSGATLSQIRKRIQSYRDRLKALTEVKRDVMGFNFKDMGIDYLVVDEAHEFKNLEYQTGASRLVGMNDPKGSQRAFDLYVKMQGLKKRGGGFTFMSGTPISNSLVEIYAMLKYLAWDELRDRKIAAFDAWSAAYVHAETRYEYTATQKLVERRVLSKLVNLGSLYQLYSSVADVMLDKDMRRAYAEQIADENRRKGTAKRTDWPVPKVKGGGRILMNADASIDQEEFTNYLVMRMQAIKDAPDKKEYAKIDNALWVLTDARKASIDIRTVDPTLSRTPQSKVVRAGTEAKRIYDATMVDRGTQIVFSDMSTPSKSAEKNARQFILDAMVLGGLSKETAKASIKTALDRGDKFTDLWSKTVVWLYNKIESEDTAPEDSEEMQAWIDADSQQDAPAAMAVADTGFSFYDDFRKYMVEQGVPQNQIAFIHDYDNDEKKLALYADVNAGRVRILMGSTPKLGAGTNVQERLVALHHVDAPWRPSDIEQREGRGIRPGNSFYKRDPDTFELEIMAYSTNGTSDVVLWQGLERKSRGIELFLSQSADVVEEESGDADQYAMFMAQSTGNPVYLLKLQTEKAAVLAYAEINGNMIGRDEAVRFLQSYEARQADYAARRDALAASNLVQMRGIDQATGKGEVVDLDTAETALAAAEAAYQVLENQWLEEEVAINKAKQAGVKPADRPKHTLEKKPKRPEMFSPEVMAASPYAKLLANNIKWLSDQRLLSENIPQTVEFRLGKWALTIRRKMIAHDLTGRLSEYRAWITVPEIKTYGEPYTISLLQADTVDPLNNSKVLAGLHPQNIRDRVAASLAMAQEQLTSLEAKLPLMQQRSEIVVDQQARIDFERAANFYAAAVSLAEMERERGQIGKVNRFAVADKKRDIRSATKSSEISGKVTFTDPIQGEFESTGPGVSLGKFVNIFNTQTSADEAYPAKRIGDDHPAIIFVQSPRAAQTNRAASPREPVAVLLDPRGPEGRGAIKERRAKEKREVVEDITSQQDLDALRESLLEELKRMGLGYLELSLAAAFRFAGATQSTLGFFLGNEIGISYIGGAKAALATLRHEAIHALRSSAAWSGPYGAFTRNEWQALVAAAKHNKRLMNWAETSYPNLNFAQRIEEVIAENFAEWSASRDNQGFLGAVYQKIASIFEAIVNALRGNGFTSEAAIFEAVRSGGVAARASEDGQVFGYGFLSDESVAEVMRMRKPITREFEAGLVSRLLTQAMAGGGRSLLGLVPGRPLFKELSKNLPSADNYQKLKDAMDTMRNEWTNRFDNVGKIWHRAIAKNNTANIKLMNLMHDSTIAGQDPSKAYEPLATPRDFDTIRTRNGTADQLRAAMERIKADRAAKAQYDALVTAYNSLPKGFQALYRKVRDEYTELSKAYEKAILANVEKAGEINIRRAQRAYDDEMKRIEDDGLIGGERTQAIDAADKKLAKVKAELGAGARSRAFQLRRKFESNRVKGPYFPLTRFGQFYVTVRNTNKEVLRFSLFETVGARDAAAREEEAKPGQIVQTGVVLDGNMKQMVDPAFVSEVEQILTGIGAPKAVMDAIWQKWLETLPELSIRRNRIHRKSVEGYDTDAFRAFGKHMFHGAHQLARLNYALDLDDALVEAKREADRSDSPTRNGLIVEEMTRRNAYTMNPTGARWSQFLTTASFLYFLAFSPSTAVMNLTQTTIVGIPTLAAMNGGRGSVRQASGQISRALLDFTRGKGHAVESGRLTDEEKDAMRQAYNSGLIDKSQSHDLAGIEASGAEFRNSRGRFMAAASWMMHHTERLNREVTFLAAYRMARLQTEPGLPGKPDIEIGHDRAISMAADATWKTHFDYQNTARPRFGQGNVSRVVLSMKNFQINMLWRLFRDMHQTVKGETPAIRKEARRTLFGITASMMIHAGVSGTWLFGAAMLIASTLFGGSTVEMKDEFKTAVVETFGARIGTAVIYGVPQALTGISISPRIGMPDLWFRDETRPAEGEDLYNQWMAQAVGAVPSIVERGLVGAEMISEGNVERGVEYMAPKPVRDLMKAARYYTEGAQTMKGDPLVDEVTTYQIIVQALGYTPAEIAERGEKNALAYAKQDEIQGERSEIMKRAAQNIMDGKPIGQEVMAEIMTFNEAHPTYGIDFAGMKASVRSRMRAHALNQGGATLNPRLEGEIRDSLSPDLFN